MYISEFVCGIGFTLIAEAFILVLYAMLGVGGKNRKDKVEGDGGSKA